MKSWNNGFIWNKYKRIYPEKCNRRKPVQKQCFVIYRRNNLISTWSQRAISSNLVILTNVSMIPKILKVFPKWFLLTLKWSSPKKATNYVDWLLSTISLKYCTVSGFLLNTLSLTTSQILQESVKRFFKAMHIRHLKKKIKNRSWR